MAGIALIGAGIFARQQHLPAIESCAGLALKAVYSRSQRSAEALAAASKDASSVAIYFDVPAVKGKSLDDLLQREDIVAVDIVLPIPHQPSVIRKALATGKHVLSEKPIAGNVVDGQELFEWYLGLGERKPVWGVAENFRFLESLAYAAQKVKEIGGLLRTFRLEKYGFVGEDNKYFNTEWRRVPQYQGGFLLDGGVHFVAALRFLLGAAGHELDKVAAFTSLLEPRLLPADTVHAVAFTKGGKSGTINITFGTEFKDVLEVEVVTTNGAVTWTPNAVTTVNRKGDCLADKAVKTKEFPYCSGVLAEVASFAQALESGRLDLRQMPAEGLKDLEVVQRMLESGEDHGVLKTVGL